MSWITEAKAELRDVLSDQGYKALAYTPTSLYAGNALVEIDDPYISGASYDGFNAKQLNLRVSVVLKTAPNKETTEQADNEIAELIDVLESARWNFSSARATIQDDSSNVYSLVEISINQTFIKE